MNTLGSDLLMDSNLTMTMLDTIGPNDTTIFNNELLQTENVTNSIESLNISLLNDTEKTNSLSITPVIPPNTSVNHKQISNIKRSQNTDNNLININESSQQRLQHINIPSNNKNIITKQHEINNINGNNKIKQNVNINNDQSSKQSNNDIHSSGIITNNDNSLSTKKVNFSNENEIININSIASQTSPMYIENLEQTINNESNKSNIKNTKYNNIVTNEQKNILQQDAYIKTNILTKQNQCDEPIKQNQCDEQIKQNQYNNPIKQNISSKMNTNIQNITTSNNNNQPKQIISQLPQKQYINNTNNQEINAEEYVNNINDDKNNIQYNEQNIQQNASQDIKSNINKYIKFIPNKCNYIFIIITCVIALAIYYYFISLRKKVTNTLTDIANNKKIYSELYLQYHSDNK